MGDASESVDILLVEDNQTNVALITAVLTSQGFRVRGAADSDQFKLRLQEKLPDLILMDIQLPGSDGLTLTRELRADAATKAIPVIALTAYAMTGDEQRALDAGCDAYLSKPFRPQRLVDLVNATLARRAER